MNTVNELHAEYCRLVESKLALTLDRIYWWEQWRAMGFTMDDLRLVIAYIQQGIKEGRRFPGALKWSNLIQDTAHSEEEVLEARAQKRNARLAPSAKEAFIRARIPITGPLVEKCTAVPIGRVIETMRAEVDKRPT